MSTPPLAGTPRAPMAIRALAGVAALAWLLAVGVPLLGIPLVAALGIGLAALLLRRRGRVLTRGYAWLVGSLVATFAIAAGFGIAILSLPPAQRAQVFSASNAQARKDVSPAPEWLERISPQGGASGNPAADRLAQSKPFQVYFGLVGGGIALLLMGSRAGSLTWVAATLGSYALAGRWLPPGERRPLPGDERFEHPAAPAG